MPTHQNENDASIDYLFKKVFKVPRLKPVCQKIQTLNARCKALSVLLDRVEKETPPDRRCGPSQSLTISNLKKSRDGTKKELSQMKKAQYRHNTVPKNAKLPQNAGIVAVAIVEQIGDILFLYTSSEECPEATRVYISQLTLTPISDETVKAMYQKIPQTKVASMAEAVISLLQKGGSAALRKALMHALSKLDLTLEKWDKYSRVDRDNYGKDGEFYTKSEEKAFRNERRGEFDDSLKVHLRRFDPHRGAKQ